MHGPSKQPHKVITCMSKKVRIRRNLACNLNWIVVVVVFFLNSCLVFLLPNKKSNKKYPKKKQIIRYKEEINAFKRKKIYKIYEKYEVEIKKEKKKGQKQQKQKRVNYCNRIQVYILIYYPYI